MKKLIPALLYSLLAVISTVESQNTLVSKLSEGDIHKFSVQESGIYKIGYEQLAEIESFNIDAVDPRKLHIYGTNGGIINQELSKNRIDDLKELAIFIEGELDGSMDPGDYILFYVEGADRYSLDNNEIEFQKNVYDLFNYIFIKEENDNGLRISKTATLNSVDFTSDSRERVMRHEIDRVNLLGAFGGTQGSGKKWFGEAFANQREQSFSSSFIFSNIIPGSEAQLDFEFVGRSDATSQVEISVDDQRFLKNILRTNTGKIERRYGYEGTVENEKIILNNNTPNVVVDFKQNSVTTEGWLDFIQIIGRESNVFNNNPYFIIDRNSLNYPTYGFSINSNAPITIWDITDMFNVKEIDATQSGSNYNFGYETDNKLKSFIAFDFNQAFGSVNFVEKVTNQNVHGIENAEFVIIYHSDFKESAERLQQHRISNDNMDVKIVDIDEIYNEFGGGKKDPTGMRDFIKMIYDRDSDFNYVLLLGDASYDYRGLLAEQDIAYQNFVPTYETDESLHPVEAFPTDDYFALINNNEGSDNLNGAIDIGIGRIPVKTNEEASAMVEKIIHYETSPSTQGDWRMKIGFAADDQDGNLHVRDADEIAEMVEQSNPELNQQKVYFDAYNQEATPGGARYPDANAALNANIFNGQLVLNYLGHGGPTGWAQERVLQINDIVNWNNLDNLPVMVTATCSFTGFDEPNFVSAGEQALLNPSGGAIALFTTTRAVYSSNNKLLTSEVFKKIFTRDNGNRLRLGDIIMDSQNQNNSDTIGSNTRKFALIGDPTVTLALPKHKITLDQYNGQPITAQSLDTIGALEKVKLGGYIEDFSNNKLTSFNGKLFLTIYDKSKDLKTLDNDNEGDRFEFQERQNILYKGSASVNSGQFEIEFILPKDINFEFGLGKLSLYATDGNLEDAGGHYDQVVIGGTSDANIIDNEGPEISIFMDDRSFNFGGNTGKDPVMIIDLSDENGINLSGTSIGHDITAQVDDPNSKGIVLNNFYEPTVDKVGTGTVEYQLSDLENGKHTLFVKAWDILNNSSEKMTEFIVAESEGGFIRNVFNYPNPFSTSTNFMFEHDLRNANLDIRINIYTVSGQLVKTIQAEKFGAGSRVDDINWNGTDDYGSKLAKGVYLYKIKIATNEFNVGRESDFQKLVILN